MLLLESYARTVLLHPDPGHHADFHAAVRALLADPGRNADMDAFVALAYSRLPAAPPTAAPRWRMLYIDASILKVLARASVPTMREDVARECIAALDHAIIIAGATTDDTRRDYVVYDVISQLQSVIPRQFFNNVVLVAQPASVPHPLSTSRNNVRTLAALPSIVTAKKHWCQAPFLIRGHAGHWPAMHHPHQWASLDYLFSVAGPGRIVPVEIGDDYRSDNWSQKLMSWEDFLSSLNPSTSHHPHHTIYLAQHSLLNQFPRLREDVLLPDIVYASLDSPDFPAYEPPPDVIVNAWIGPKGTVSPAHTDPFFNCYVQVVGRKTVWLAPPHVAPAMYPYQSSASSHNPAANTTCPHMSNTSQVDVFTQDMETSQTAFPLFWASVPDQASCVTLDPGDLLFFPPGWWHAMRSEDASFSVSMWF